MKDPFHSFHLVMSLGVIKMLYINNLDVMTSEIIMKLLGEDEARTNGEN